jgi:hypothetical protein
VESGRCRIHKESSVPSEDFVSWEVAAPDLFKKQSRTRLTFAGALPNCDSLTLSFLLAKHKPKLKVFRLKLFWVILREPVGKKMKNPVCSTESDPEVGARHAIISQRTFIVIEVISWNGSVMS